MTAPAAPDGVRPDLGPLWGVVGARSGLLLLFGACLSWSSPDLRATGEPGVVAAIGFWCFLVRSVCDRSGGWRPASGRWDLKVGDKARREGGR